MHRYRFAFAVLALGLAATTGCLSDAGELGANSQGSGASDAAELEPIATEGFQAALDVAAGTSYVQYPSDSGTLTAPDGASLALVNLTWTDTASFEEVDLRLCAGPCSEGEEHVEAHGSSPLEVSTVVPDDGEIGWRVGVERGAAADQTVEGEATYLAGPLPGPEGTPEAIRFDANHERLASPDPLPATYRLVGHEGAEPNLGVASDGTIFTTAHDRVVRSEDEGRTWEQVWKFGAEDDALGEDGLVTNNDPMFWLDPATDRVFADPMWPVLACSYLAWSDDGGDSWTERPGVCHPPPMDHQKLSGGPPGPEAPPIAGEAYPNVLYQCYNQVTSTVCAVSYDGGVDWTVHQVANHPGQDECYGVNGKVAVGPEGIGYLPLAEECDQPALAVTTDSGLTWTLRELPTGPSGENDPDVEVGPEGTVYLLYHDGEFTFRLARSTDRGHSWEGPWKVTPPGTQAAAFPALEVGPEGRPAMAFLTTTDAVPTPSEAPPDTTWHLQVVTVEGPRAADPAFTAHRITPRGDPVQIGCIWLGGFPGEPCRNLLDFIDAQAAPDGSLHIAYTEGCLDHCASNPLATGANSRASQIALATVENVFAAR